MTGGSWLDNTTGQYAAYSRRRTIPIGRKVGIYILNDWKIECKGCSQISIIIHKIQSYTVHYIVYDAMMLKMYVLNVQRKECECVPEP